MVTSTFSTGRFRNTIPIKPPPSLQLPQSLANSHSSAQAMSCFSDSPCFTIINTEGKKTKENRNERKETGKGQTAY